MADGGRRGRARIDQPMTPRRGPIVQYDAESFGRTTETIARFLGTGRYLVIQSVFIVIWVVVNVVPGIPHFDPYTFTFLTLILSLQAAYAAPLILLAQNRQDDRDRINMDDDRAVAAQNKAEVEYLAREIAAIRVALGEIATRDFLRSELARLGERDKPSGKKTSGKKPAGAAKDPEPETARPATEDGPTVPTETPTPTPSPAGDRDQA